MSRVIGRIDGSLLVIINMGMILLTWGVIFPPLAVMACVAICVRTYHIQIGIGRRLSLVDNTYYTQLEAVVAECTKIPLYMNQALIPVLWMACVYYGLIVQDSEGDDGGYTKSNMAWFLLLLAFGPFVLFYCGNYLTKQW